MKKIFMFRAMFFMFVISSVTVFSVSLYSRSLATFLTGEMESNIELRLKETARRGAAMVTAEELESYQSPDDMSEASYQALRHKLKNFAEVSGVLYIYYLRADQGKMQFIIDNDFDENTRVGLDTPRTDVTLTPGLSWALEGVVSSPLLGSYMAGWEGLLSAYAPIFDAAGRVAAVCGVDIDDTAILKARDRTRLLWSFELGSVAVILASGLFCLVWYRREARAARSANVLKSRIMSHISHEIRTPLTAMSIKLHIARTFILDGMTEALLETISALEDEAGRLGRMTGVAMALEMLQTDYGDMSDLDVGRLLKAASETYRPLIERRGNRLAVEIPDDLPRISGNADGLIEVFVNLVSNANAHMKNGAIKVAAACDLQGPRMITVAVEDTGPGIEPGALPAIFQRRLRKGHKEDFGEAGGIGLSICKEIVERHGGNIGIESEPGRGTKVLFSLPASKARAEKNR